MDMRKANKDIICARIPILTVEEVMALQCFQNWISVWDITGLS